MITAKDIQTVLTGNNNGFATVHYVSEIKTNKDSKHVRVYKEVKAQVQLFHKDTAYETAVKKSAGTDQFKKSKAHFEHDPGCYSVVYSNGNPMLYCRYIRVLSAKYFVDGKEVAKEEIRQYLTPSEAKKQFHDGTVYNVRNDITHKVIMRTIGLKNIISLTFGGQTITNFKETEQTA